MKLQNNITIFSGDTRNNVQAEWKNKEGTDSYDKKSRTIYAGNFLKEFPLRERIQQKRAEVQQPLGWTGTVRSSRNWIA